MKLKFITLLTGILAASNVSATDCGWSELSSDLKQRLTNGESVVEGYGKGSIDSYKVKGWVIAKGVSAAHAAVVYWDFTRYSDPSGLVDKVELSEGYNQTVSPTRYDVTPGDNNPFGDLYQPFKFEFTVQSFHSGYKFRWDTLTSSNLIHDADTQLCFGYIAEIDATLVAHDTKFVGNPDVGFDIPGLSLEERKAIWAYSIKNHTNRMEKMTPNSNQVLNFRKALLGSIEN